MPRDVPHAVRVVRLELTAVRQRLLAHGASKREPVMRRRRRRDAIRAEHVAARQSNRGAPRVGRDWFLAPRTAVHGRPVDRREP